MDNSLLGKVAQHAADYLAGVPERPVGPRAGHADLRARLGGPLPEGPTDAETVIGDLARAAADGLVGSAGPRYFGFVVGGAMPSALAADWLTSVWDQNAGGYVLSPAAAVVEEVASGWLLELFGLPATASAGFTTGATMANFVCLAAARSHVLETRGWDVERDGMFAAPPIEVVVGEERHISGSMSMGRSGCGPRHLLAIATWCVASHRPTRGRPTRTNG
jgi:glutamate/tyrosine decarboxylase-like PLP-dependent enzyme